MSDVGDRVAADMIGKARTVGQGIASRDAELATRHLDPRSFKQHNLECADGVEGVREFVGSLHAVGGPINVARAFRDEDHVVVHSVGDIFGEKVFFDIFRFDNGLIVEHWDNLADTAPANRSGRLQADGPAALRDHDRTDHNKKPVRAFFEKAFLDGRLDDADDFFDGDALVQHNANGADGLAALKQMMAKRAQAGETLEKARIRHVLGEGDLVLVAADGLVGGAPTAFYDLFRVEAGKIAEHWDVVGPIPPREDWKNDNGKF